MTSYQLHTFLALYVTPFIVELFAKQRGVSRLEAIKTIYRSKLYALLYDEKTKLWHLSPNCLFRILTEEISSGKLTLPEEA